MDALSAHGIEGACRCSGRKEGDKRCQDHGLTGKDQRPSIRPRGRCGVLRHRRPDALPQAGRRRDRRERGEDGNRGHRGIHGLLQPVAKALEAPVDDPKVEAERTAELRVAKPVAKLQVEKQVVVDGERRDLGPDRIDGLLVARDCTRVGETIRVDLGENMEVGGRRGTVVRQFRGEKPVQPRTQIVHWPAPELGEGARERSADHGPRFVRGSQHPGGYIEKRTEEPAVENGEVFVSPGPLLDDVHQSSEESADSRRAVGGLEGRNRYARRRRETTQKRATTARTARMIQKIVIQVLSRSGSLILVQAGESSATRSGDLSPLQRRETRQSSEERRRRSSSSGSKPGS